jgi:NAD(P)H-nitrite reductase large subunit
VIAETAASTCCGGCAPTVARIVDEELGTADDSASRSTRPLRVLRSSSSEAA